MPEQIFNEPEKNWFSEKYQSASNQKRTKTQTKKTMPQFKASSNILFCGGENAVGSKSSFLLSTFSLVSLLFLFDLPGIQSFPMYITY